MQALPGDRGTPNAVVSAVGGNVRASDVRSAYAHKVALRGDKHCRLAEVTTCWSKQADGRIGKQVDCPDHVMRSRDSPKCSSFVISALGQCYADDMKKRR